MALRLRRGTDAERLIMTPPEAGELIYTTDTKAVYVGDGTTVGGLPVSGQALGIDDLGNVTVTTPSDGDILKWNGTAWINTPQESLEKPGNIYGTDSTLLIDTDNSVIVGPIVSDTAIIGDLIGDVTGNVVGDLIGDVTGTVTGNVIGTLDGDVTGSVFSDDSSILIDAINKTASISNFQSPDNLSVFGTDEDETTCKIVMNTVGEGSQIFSHLQLVRKSDTDLAGSNINYGLISFNRDDANGFQQTALIGGRDGKLVFASTSTGDVFNAANYFGWGDQKFGIGTINPSYTLDVQGEIVAQSYVQFGSLTTTERDALTAANGMVIYNTTDNKFQGYENGAWVNLI